MTGLVTELTSCRISAAEELLQGCPQPPQIVELVAQYPAMKVSRSRMDFTAARLLVGTQSRTR